MDFQPLIYATPSSSRDKGIIEIKKKKIQKPGFTYFCLSTGPRNDPTASQ
jgi:hypothetical protein